MPVLTVNQLSKSYGDQRLLSNLSLQLDEGEKLALTGPNGTGKTTLLRLIMGLESPDAGTIHLPDRHVCGYLSQKSAENEGSMQRPLFDPQLARLEEKMRRLEQQMNELGHENKAQMERLMASYSKVTSQFETDGGYEFQHRMQETSHGLGLPPDCLSRPWHTLSGGERMRVALARLLLRDPDLLLLDEPTNHLDLTALEWLENYLAQFRGTVLYVTHDRMFMNKTATSVAYLGGGHLFIRPGNYDSFLKLQAEEKETLSRRLKKQENEVQRQANVKQTLLSHRDISGYHAREKVLERLTGELEQLRQRARQLNQSPHVHFRFSPPAAAGSRDKLILQARDLAVAYDHNPLFVADQLTLSSREKVGLCGPNGCGKTTLLQLFLGKKEAQSGQVTIDPRSVFGYLGQHAQFADETQSVLETLYAHTLLSETQARTLLSRYGFLGDEVQKTVKVLSGGERSRLYLCLLLLEQPDLLLLDEPTNHLDIDSREILEQALCDYQGAILAVSHDRYFIQHCCDRIYGFIGDQVLPFREYDHYRQSLRKEVKSSSPQPRPKGRKVKTEKNPARLRQLQAKQKKKLQDAEKEIRQLEEEKQDLESRLGASSPPDDYERYAAISEKLETLYQQYVTLAESVDQGTRS